MEMTPDKVLRDQILYLLDSGGAHIGFAAAIKDFPDDLIGQRIPNLDHTAWQLVYHLWIAQWDILEFTRNPNHVSPEYPHGYWPDGDAPGQIQKWHDTISEFLQDLAQIKALVADPESDLFSPLPHGSGQTLLREALLVADHNAYHVGQFVDLRMLLGVPVRDY
jgi:hypothetical protein